MAGVNTFLMAFLDECCVRASFTANTTHIQICRVSLQLNYHCTSSEGEDNLYSSELDTIRSSALTYARTHERILARTRNNEPT